MEKLPNRKWEVLSSKYLIHEPWCTVRADHVRLPNGNEIKSYYVFEFYNWVNIIARTKDGLYVMVSQYRHGFGDTRYELVAGTCDHPDETPLKAAQRELWEETGYGHGQWTLFMTMSPNTSSHNNLTYTFLAEDVELIDTQHLEPSEDIQVHLLKESEVMELLVSGELIQALMAAPLWKYFAQKGLCGPKP